jgi:hypothetical protein
LTCGLAAAAHAAAPPPESTANCYGTVAPSPAPDEPNSLAYKFQCDERITAYTILIDRGANDYDTLDDFSINATVFQPDGTTPNTSTVWSCEGYTPSQSVNCNTGSATGYVGALSYSEGMIDPTGPYCKYLPPGAKPGTWAQPQALVQLVVTDYTGAEDGPFRLYYTRKCRSVPNRVPAKTAQKHQAKGSK